MGDQLWLVDHRPVHNPVLQRKRIPAKEGEPLNLILPRAQRARRVEPKHASRLQHPERLGEGAIDVLDVLHHAIGQHHMNRFARKGQSLRNPVHDLQRNTETLSQTVGIFASEWPWFYSPALVSREREREQDRAGARPDLENLCVGWYGR